MAQCTLTAATCDPASTSASISARLLYCCGDSITISLLGALPARPCMVLNRACECSLKSGVRFTAHTLPWHKVAHGVWEVWEFCRASSEIPSALNHNSPASLSLSPALSLIMVEPLPPSQLHSCEGVCGCVCLYVQYVICVWRRRGGEINHSPIKTSKRPGDHVVMRLLHLPSKNVLKAESGRKR